MTKARLTIVIEYPMNPQDYDGETDPETMLQVDRDNFDEMGLEAFAYEQYIVDTIWEVIG